MQKKSFIQIMIIVVFALMAAASTTTSNSRSSQRSSTYYRPSTISTPTQSQTPTSNTPMKIEKTEFPKPACKTCHGRKGYYLFDIWCPCKRCGGTGLEPEH